MKATDRTLLIALPAIAVIVAFWLLVIAPKREQASSLQTEVTRLESEVSEQEQLADLAQQARDHFSNAYRKVVKLGKAVPQADETPSLFAMLSGVSANAGVSFDSLELNSAEGGGTGSSTAPPPATTPPPATDSSSTASSSPTGSSSAPASSQDAAASGSATTPTTTPSAAPATEAAAADLPIGATVGPAGLPIMPYTLKFRGDFFHVADFVAGIQGQFELENNRLSAKAAGRLMTIDGFSLNQDPGAGFPSLLATFAVTTYVTPATQGLTAGASPSGPAPVTDSAAPTTTTAAQTSNTVPAP